jgi:hypothetical protein
MTAQTLPPSRHTRNILRTAVAATEHCLFCPTLVSQQLQTPCVGCCYWCRHIYMLLSCTLLAAEQCIVWFSPLPQLLQCQHAPFSWVTQLMLVQQAVCHCGHVCVFSSLPAIVFVVFSLPRCIEPANVSGAVLVYFCSGACTFQAAHRLASCSCASSSCHRV